LHRLVYETERTAVAERLLKLFFVERQHYGADYGNGLTTVKQPITRQVILKHLQGHLELAAHAIESQRSLSLWSCWDLDRGGALTLYHKLTRKFPKSSLVLEETGGSGYHVWLMYKVPTPSEIAYGISRLYAAGVTDEYYPAERWIQPGGYGRMCRIPLGYRRSTGRWSRLIHPKSILNVEPCLPGRHIDLNVFREPVPWSIRQARCPYKIPDRTGTLNCLYRDGSVGLCAEGLCPRWRR